MFILYAHTRAYRARHGVIKSGSIIRLKIKFCFLMRFIIIIVTYQRLHEVCKNELKA